MPTACYGLACRVLGGCWRAALRLHRKPGGLPRGPASYAPTALHSEIDCQDPGRRREETVHKNDRMLDDGPHSMAARSRFCKILLGDRRGGIAATGTPESVARLKLGRF